MTRAARHTLHTAADEARWGWCGGGEPMKPSGGPLPGGRDFDEDVVAEVIGHRDWVGGAPEPGPAPAADPPADKASDVEAAQRRYNDLCNEMEAKLRAPAAPPGGVDVNALIGALVDSQRTMQGIVAAMQSESTRWRDTLAAALVQP
jgi:hypothetical protein